MKNDFKHKVVVVTGATGGIGRALSWQFAKAGARIVLIDLEMEQLLALENQVERSGTEVMSIECDITDYERCQTAMQEITDRFGGVDVLINNAGIVNFSLFHDTQIDVIREIMEVNFFGTINTTKAALSSLIERKGMIITLSSLHGLIPMVAMSSYSASKYALHGLFDSLRVELNEKGVHVMLACPGRTETDLNIRALGGDGTPVKIPRRTSTQFPGEVAEEIFLAAQRNRRLVINSGSSKLTQWLYRRFPSYYEQKVLMPLLKSR